MDKQADEQKVFDMAKQDIPFLRNLELVKHDDRPDFVLKDKVGRIIGLEHFKADVYRVQDENSSHIRGGHSVLNELKEKIFQKYHPLAMSDDWTHETTEAAVNDMGKILKESLDMRSNYTYEAFLDNLHAVIHGRPSKVKGHIQKSKKYPERASYDLMGFLIEIPVPSFRYYFETPKSRQSSRAGLLLRKNQHDDSSLCVIPRQYNDAYSYHTRRNTPCFSYGDIRRIHK